MTLENFKKQLAMFCTSKNFDGPFYVTRKKYNQTPVDRKFIVYQRIRKSGYRFANNKTQSFETRIQITLVLPSHEINCTNEFEKFMEDNNCFITLIDDSYNLDDNYSFVVYETYIKE